MSPEETTRLGAETLALLMKEGTGVEKDLSPNVDPYKPLYRAISVMVRLFKTDESLGRAPTQEEGEAILRASHPWFDRTLDGPKSYQTFETLWDFHFECWWDPKTGVYRKR